MSNVYLYGPTYSTLFTSCCDVAILPYQTVCPKCKGEVRQQGERERWAYAYGKAKRQGYGNI